MIEKEEFHKLEENGAIYWANDTMPYGKKYLHEAKGQIINDWLTKDFGTNQRGSNEINVYPLAIVLMLLTFLSPLFNHERFVYVATIGVTFLISIVDGFKALSGTLEVEFGWLTPIVNFYDQFLPFYSEGLGWLIPALVVIIITGIIARIMKSTTPEKA